MGAGEYGLTPLSVFFVSLVAINQHPSPGSHTPLELNMVLGSYKHAALRVIAKKSMKYYKFSASRLLGFPKSRPVISLRFLQPSPRLTRRLLRIDIGKWSILRRDHQDAVSGP